MRSYEAARRYFSILEFIAWCLIVLGGFIAIVAFAAIAEANRRYGGSPALLVIVPAILPGSGIAFAGFMGLVVAQVGRAGVDSAEYGQQSLKIARDQLELSKQALRQGAQAEPSYAALQAAKKDLQPDTAVSKGAAPSASYAAPPSETHETAKLAPPRAEALEYKGRVIQPENGQFVFGKMQFQSLEAAQRYIDQLGVNPKADLGGVTRS